MPGDALFRTLLMSAGLTFGTTSSMYGIQAGIPGRAPSSVFVAIVPTFDAHHWFATVGAEERGEILAQEREEP
ncbi:MAG TPA: hypothetical protein VFI25_06640 [Planctomycetota bacterium]|nr:hypothetical protein [Planctomycetota bacterium]